MCPVVNKYIDYLFVKNERTKIQTTTFKTKFVNYVKDVLRRQTNEFKFAMLDWRKMEKDSKELLDDYERVFVFVFKIKYEKSFIIKFKIQYMKSSKEAEEIQIIEKCAGYSKDLNFEKRNKIQTKYCAIF